MRHDSISRVELFSNVGLVCRSVEPSQILKDSSLAQVMDFLVNFTYTSPEEHVKSERLVATTCQGESRYQRNSMVMRRYIRLTLFTRN